MDAMKKMGNRNILHWDWDESVNRIRNLYGKYRNSPELMNELYQAKNQICNGPGNPHGKFTWKDFVEQTFGKYPTLRTVDTWLRKYEIGSEAYAVEQNTKKNISLNQGPQLVEDMELFISKSMKNSDGSYTVRIEVSEYPGTVFEESISA